MNEKVDKNLLPSNNEYVIGFPKDVQQLIGTNSNAIIDKNHSNRFKSSCCRQSNTFTVMMLAAITTIILVPMLYQLKNFISISGTVDSGYYVSINHDMLNSLSETKESIERMMASLSNEFGKKQLTSNNNEPNAAILYLQRDPFYSMSDFFEFNSVYIARNYQTTLTFLLQNNQSTTYLDDVSVNSTYGSQLIVNGDFSNGKYGWQGFFPSNTYYYLNYVASSSTINGTLSQTFSTRSGDTLYIRFKLRWYGSGPGVFTKVTIY